MHAVEEALRVRSRHGIAGVATDAQLRRVAAAEGVDVLERPLTGRLYGFYFLDTIVLRRPLLPATRRFVLAHELVHHVLGHGFARFDSTDGRLPRSHRERDAAQGSFALLLGRPATTLDGLTDQIQQAASAGLAEAAPALYAAASVLIPL